MDIVGFEINCHCISMIHQSGLTKQTAHILMEVIPVNCTLLPREVRVLPPIGRLIRGQEIYDNKLGSASGAVQVQSTQTGYN